MIGDEPITVKGVHEASPEHDTVVVGTPAIVAGVPFVEVKYVSCPAVSGADVATLPPPPPPESAVHVTAPLADIADTLSVPPQVVAEMSV